MFKLIKNLLRRIFLPKVYYINTHDYLPEPLKEDREKELLLSCKDGDINARNELIEHNLRLVVYIAKKYESTKANLEDLISLGSMGLIKAVQTFKIDKNIKLATYASRCIENEILMFLRKVSKMKIEISLDETLNTDSDGNELLLSDILGTDSESAYLDVLKLEKEKVMYEAIEKLSKREKEIISLRFGLFNTNNLTQKEVADLLGISQSYISRLEKRIILKLRHHMNEKITIK